MRLTPRTARPLRAVPLALVLVLTGALTASAAPPPRAQETPPVQDAPLVTFGISPAGPQAPDERPFLEYGVSPGSVVLDRVAVLNQSDVPLDLQVYAGDGLNGEGGGLDIAQRAQRNTDLGAWVTLGDAVATGSLDPSSRSLTTVSVPPQDTRTGRGTTIVPVRIAVPSDASPGDHVGGIAASLISRSAGTGAQDVELEQRVVARVLLRVAGPLEPSLSVDVLDADYVAGAGLGLSGGMRVTYRITNTGNVRLGATSRLQVSGPLGLLRSTVAGAPAAELVPRGSAVLTTTVPGVPPTGLATVRVTVDAVPPPGGAVPGAATATDSLRAAALTRQQLLALLLVLLVAAAAVWWRRRTPPGRHGRRGTNDVDLPTTPLVGQGSR